MSDQFSRTEQIVGTEGIKKLSESRVLLFGLGGVGGAVLETLARAGIGTLGICDGDRVSVTNLNRQLLATHKTVGSLKTDAARDRITDINPCATVIPYPFFYHADTADAIDFKSYDFIADAIDQVSAKLSIIERAKAEQIPVISCMGTGNKYDPSRFRISAISQTTVCPLAKIMRTELKKRGIEDVPVVYSDESPAVRVSPPASLPFVPPAAGMILAGYIIQRLLGVPAR